MILRFAPTPPAKAPVGGRPLPRRRPALPLAALPACRLAAALALLSSLSAAPVDYPREIKPLLTQHCVRCHGADREEGGLRLDTAAALHEGGTSGSALRRTTRQESLLLQVVAGSHDDIPAMPYKKPRLAEREIALLRAWVEQGAAAPDDEVPGRFDHWAFTAPRRPQPPVTRNRDWPRHDLDRFILARLEAENIAPAPAADRVTLLRRVSLDLIGLPPTPAEVEAFVADSRPDAYERVVDRLLASPHFGERWARPWLDVARYADSNGYSIDAPRQIWKYRDWVVAALNRDLPFDQFVIEQLAGDLLPHPTVDQRIATGFNRNTQINQEGGIDPEQFRIESVLDRVNTYGTAFLGLTVACAQCHDHKFDPVSQKDYYQLYAFFNSSVDDGHGSKRPGGALYLTPEGTPDLALLRDLEAAHAAVEKHLEAHHEAVEAWRLGVSPADRAEYSSSSLRAALDVPWERQSFSQRRAVFGAARPDDAEFLEINRHLTGLERRESRTLATLVMEELPVPRPSYVFIKGDFTRRGPEIGPGTPAVLPPLRVARPNRLDLARWTVDPANPLPARVMVNRIWQHYFGRGLVETENDFGSQGAPPTHPALLDWLATEFIARQWSMKAMHRLIVTSATYRQSSHARPDLDLADPLNHLLARQSRLRLDAEVVRDAALAACGLLVPRLGGPPVFPPQPDGVMTLGQVKREWKPSTGADRHRRGLYTHFWRATPHPALAVFDAADGFSACTRRLRSNTPLQALTLLNDRQFFEFAGALADLVAKEFPAEQVDGGLDFAFRRCLARAPTPEEHSRLAALYHQQFAAAGDDEGADAATRRHAAWVAVARVILNLDETITRE